MIAYNYVSQVVALYQGHFRRNRECIPGISVSHSFPDRILTRKVMVHPCCVTVCEAPVKKAVDHFFQLRHINCRLVAGVCQRHPHKAKSKFFLRFHHCFFPLKMSYSDAVSVYLVYCFLTQCQYVV